LGLWTKWRHWSGTGDCVDLGRTRPNLTNVFIAPTLALTTGEMNYEPGSSEGRSKERCR
jgi:hypothetical protein